MSRGIKMNKKILFGSILAVLMLVAISYATALGTTNVEKKESPLYRIRTRQAINEKVSEIIKDIKAKFFGERIFFLNFQPVKWLLNLDDFAPRNQFVIKFPCKYTLEETVCP
jgi:hypothetical protein